MDLLLCDNIFILRVSTLTLEAENRRAISTGDLLPAIVFCLSTHMTNAAIVVEACNVVSKLAAHNGINIFM